MLDVVKECRDASLRSLTFGGIDTGSALFFWHFKRNSKWARHGDKRQYNPTVRPEPRDDRRDRCHEKLEKDVAFVNVMITPKNRVATHLMLKYDIVDQFAILGKALFGIMAVGLMH